MRVYLGRNESWIALDRLIGYRAQNDRPKMRPMGLVKGKSGWFAFRDEVHEWLAERGVAYELFYERTGREFNEHMRQMASRFNCWVEIPDADQALLFKLTWVGK